jgi:hypothetical protein
MAGECKETDPESTLRDESWDEEETEDSASEDETETREEDSEDEDCDWVVKHRRSCPICKAFDDTSEVKGKRAVELFNCF